VQAVAAWRKRRGEPVEIDLARLKEALKPDSTPHGEAPPLLPKPWAVAAAVRQQLVAGNTTAARELATAYLNSRWRITCCTESSNGKMRARARRRVPRRRRRRHSRHHECGLDRGRTNGNFRPLQGRQATGESVDFLAGFIADESRKQFWAARWGWR
jgi:hypothetical protein